MSTGFGSRKLAQIAFVVNDIEAAIDRWADLLGIDKPEVILTDPGNAVHADYRGQPTNDRAKLAFFDLGGVQLELIEPVGSNSAWAEGLPELGERFHHIAFWVDDMGESTEFLAGRGIERIQRGDMGQGEYAYFDATAQVRCMIELLAKG